LKCPNSAAFTFNSSQIEKSQTVSHPKSPTKQLNSDVKKPNNAKNNLRLPIKNRSRSRTIGSCALKKA
jgi:hypothetical protein